MSIIINETIQHCSKKTTNIFIQKLLTSIAENRLRLNDKYIFDLCITLNCEIIDYPGVVKQLLTQSHRLKSGKRDNFYSDSEIRRLFHFFHNHFKDHGELKSDPEIQKLLRHAIRSLDYTALSERDAVEIIYFSSTIGFDFKSKSVDKRLIPVMKKLKSIELDGNDTCKLLQGLFNFNKFKTEGSKKLHQFFKPHLERICHPRNKKLIERKLIESIAPIACMLRMQGLISDEIFSCFKSTQHDLVVSSNEKKVFKQLKGIQRANPDKIIAYDQSKIHCKFETLQKKPERNKIIIVPQCEMYPKSELVVDFNFSTK